MSSAAGDSPRPSPLRALYRPLRGAAHRLLSAARGGGGVRVDAPDGTPIRVHPRGYADLRYWFRYEGPTFAALSRALRPGMAILDVGAHHGLFSLCCCRAGSMPARIVCVEPSPSAWPALEANLGIHPRLPWTLVRAAAGDAPGRLRLHAGYIDMLVIDAASHAATGGAPIAAGGAPIEVRSATLDAICAETHLAPDLVKIDVEGCDAEALRGAGGLWRRRPALILEWHVAMLRGRGVDPVAALAPLAAAGYCFEPYEYPELGVVAAEALQALPPRDIYRLLCLAR